MTKPTLVPLPVPWKVDSGCPRLQLFAFESASDGPTRIRLSGFFGPIQCSNGANATSDSTAHEPQQEWGGHDIEVVFHDPRASRLLPGFSDSEVIQESLYDWSMINVDYSISEGVEEFQRRFWNTWRQTGLCPDPGVYTIEFSDWLRSLALKAEDFKHFMICGHDSYVEVVARTFSWAISNRLNGQKAGQL